MNNFGLVSHGCFNPDILKSFRNQESNVFILSEKLKRRRNERGGAT